MKLITPHRCLALVLGCLCLSTASMAQSSASFVSRPGPGQPQYVEKAVTWPQEGAVFQQGADGKGEIAVHGFLNSFAFSQGQYTVVARLQPLDVKTGNPLPGGTTLNKTITSQNTFFNTTFSAVNAGWYALRVTFTPQTTGSRTYSVGPIKVGIGEVFIIAGQSNAQGLPNVQGVADAYKVAQPFAVNTNAYDGVRIDRFYQIPDVATTASNLYDVTYLTPFGAYPRIRTLTGVNSLVNVYDAGIGPTGNSLWYWAKLGERIVNEKNVPVAFFNAALGGTSITEWERSIDVNKRVIGRGEVSNFWGGAIGLPFTVLSRTLNLYTSLYGARAVLWMQGEADASAQADNAGWGEITVINWNGGPQETYDRTVRSSAAYAQKLQRVIAESRALFQNRNLSWIVAKASYQSSGAGTTTSQLVRDGQQIVINTIPGVFAGPDMDQIIDTDPATGQARRRTPADNTNNDQYGTEPTHLKGIGLTQAANAWFDAINGPGKLLNGAAPPITITDLGTVAQSLTLSDNGQTITAPAGSIIRWLDETTGNGIDPNFPVSFLQSISATGTNNSSTGSSGFRRALIQNGNGNFIITQAVPYPYGLVDDTQPPTCNLPTNACYTIKSVKTDKRIQAMGDNSVQQQDSNNATNQLWKVDDRGNNQVSFTVQDGTSRAVRTPSGASNFGEGLALSTYTGGNNQDWKTECNPADASSRRVFFPANNNTWDLQNFGNNPPLGIWGNTAEAFQDYRSFRFEAAGCPPVGASCNFALAPTASDGNLNRSCGQATTLNANCSGGDCGGVSYAWSGNGSSGSGTSVAFNVPNANGSYVYTVTASKAGCGNQSGTITLNVAGCGPANPCAAYTVGTQVGYRSPATGDPSIKVVVSEVGGCKRAVWSDGSGAVNRDWLPYVTANPGFSITQIGACLKFSDEPCNARLGVTEPLNSVTELLLTIAPNPSNGQFTVRFQTKAGQVVSLRLSDLTGRAVRPTQTIMGTGQQHQEAIQLPAQVHGVLLLEVVSGQQRGSQKVLID